MLQNVNMFYISSAVLLLLVLVYLVSVKISTIKMPCFFHAVIKIFELKKSS